MMNSGPQATHPRTSRNSIPEAVFQALGGTYNDLGDISLPLGEFTHSSTYCRISSAHGLARAPVGSKFMLSFWHGALDSQNSSNTWNHYLGSQGEVLKSEMKDTSGKFHYRNSDTLKENLFRFSSCTREQLAQGSIQILGELLALQDPPPIENCAIKVGGIPAQCVELAWKALSLGGKLLSTDEVERCQSYMQLACLNLKQCTWDYPVFDVKTRAELSAITTLYGVVAQTILRKIDPPDARSFAHEIIDPISYLLPYFLDRQEYANSHPTDELNYFDISAHARKLEWRVLQALTSTPLLFKQPPDGSFLDRYLCAYRGSSVAIPGLHLDTGHVVISGSGLLNCSQNEFIIRSDGIDNYCFPSENILGPDLIYQSTSDMHLVEIVVPNTSRLYIDPQHARTDLFQWLKSQGFKHLLKEIPSHWLERPHV